MRKIYSLDRAFEYLQPSELEKMTGRGRDDFLLVVFKELIDNAIDEAELVEHPAVKVRVEGREYDCVISVENNGGNGFSNNLIEKIVDFNQRTSDKLVQKGITRGALGNALKTVLGIYTVYSGKDKPLFESNGKEWVVDIKADTETQEVETRVTERESELEDWTRITISCQRPLKKEAINSLMRGMVVLNPHVNFEFDIGQQNFSYPPVVENKSFKMTKANVAIAHYTEDDFINHINTEIANNNGDITVRQFVSTFDGCSGSRKQKTILDGFDYKRIRDLKGEDKAKIELLRRIRLNTQEPQHRALGMIGKKAFLERCQQIGKIDTKSVKYSKETQKLNGKPYTFEAFFCEADRHSERIGINFTPTYGNDPFSQVFFVGHTRKNQKNPPAGHGVWGLARSLKVERDDPVFFFSHYVCPNIAFTDRAKEKMALPDYWHGAVDTVTKVLKKWYRQKKNKAKGGTGKSWIISLPSFEDYWINKVRNLSEQELDVRKSKRIALLWLTMLDVVREYDKMTIRQLYYQMVARGYIYNAKNSYSNLDGHLTDARECGFIDWANFTDRASPEATFDEKNQELEDLISSDKEEKITGRLKDALVLDEDFTYPVWENQEHYVEVWIEKDALYSIFKPVAEEYQVRLFVSKGYTSLTKLEEAKKRLAKRREDNQKPVILYFGDIDSSGLDIYKKIKEKLGEKVERIGITKVQAEKFAMPPCKINEKDPRTPEFLKDHDEAYELDALPPDALQVLAGEAIETYIDKDVLEAVKSEAKEWKSEFEAEAERIESRMSGIVNWDIISEENKTES